MKKTKTSLEKSHSVWSNTKLTSLCIITILLISLFWLSLGFFIKISLLTSDVIATLASSILGILSILCLFGFKNFTR